MDDIQRSEVRAPTIRAEVAAVPTHRDYPWERDRRAAEQQARPASEPSAPMRRPGQLAPRRRDLGRRLGPLEVTVCLGVCALLFSVKAYQSEHSPASASPVTPTLLPAVVQRPAVPSVSGPISGLHSRFVSAARVQVWGRVDAADGTSVRVDIRPDGGPVAATVVAPTANRHFYAFVRVPKQLRGHRVVVAAAMGR
jgi:hypothetical protein